MTADTAAVMFRRMNEHAALRAKERYGVTADAADLRQAVLDIIDTVSGVRSAAMMLRLQSDGREHWMVRIAGAEVRAVYDPEKAMIITVLRMDRGLKHRTSPTTQNTRGRQRRERRRAEEWD